MPMSQNLDCQKQAKKIAVYQSSPFRYSYDELKQISQYCSSRKQHRKAFNIISSDIKTKEIHMKLDILLKGVSVDDKQIIKNLQNKNNFAQKQAQKLAQQHTSVSDYKQDELKQILQFCKGKNQYQKVVKIISGRIQTFHPTSSWFNKLPQFVLKVLPNQFTRSSQFSALPHQD